MTTPYRLGVDGGGSGCRARLVDAGGRRLGEGEAGPANIATDVDGAWASILQAAAAAFAAADLPASAMVETAAGLGLAGGNVPRFVTALLGRPNPFRALAVRSDADIACLGAHAGRDGGILILGTGSQGLVMRDGRSMAVGGWGFALSDTGSGAVLGHRAARRALLGHEAIEPPSSLTKAIMARFDADPDAMLAWAQAARPREWATLAPLVVEHAAAGDPVGLDLMTDAAKDVGHLVARLVDMGAGRITLVGGLAKVYLPYLAPETRAPLVPAEGDALDGALILAGRG